MKLWSKGYDLDAEIERYTVGDDLESDLGLVIYDCRASIAHAHVLEKAGVLSAEETGTLVAELERLREAAQAGDFVFRPGEEDCHTALENRLCEELGDVGKKIHTARSRNDQVVVALRLYMKDGLEHVSELAAGLAGALERRVEADGTVEMPGYSHMRRAMPSSIGLWLGSFVEGLREDEILLAAVRDLLDGNPLGSGAGYGIPVFALDRALSAEELGFSRVQDNPINVQNSRGKFEASAVSALINVMADLNRLASDLILFSMEEFGFVRLPAEFCTGSSIMPQKFNPDVLEVMRARYHDVLAREFQIRSSSANLVSGYHRDYQRTKRPLMEAFEMTRASVAIMTRVVEELSIDREACALACSEDLRATERVYELVREGMPFRDAYRKVAAEFVPEG